MKKQRARRKMVSLGPVLGALAATSLVAACTLPSQDTSEEEDTETPVAETVDYATRGLEAAETFPGLTNLCDMDMVFRDVNVPRTSQTRPAGEQSSRTNSSRSREERPSLPAMQVFDNLYFVGNSGVSAWLLGTEEDGFILLDALTSNEVAERDIIGGMESLGLDPADVKHFIVTHGHGDHYGGHRYLTEKLGLPVGMSGPDWVLAGRLGTHPRFGPAPTTGITLEDGQEITLGDTQIKLFVTSAHTPGTISPIMTVYDNGVPHKAILWGGTGLNFGPDSRRLREYAASANRLREISAQEGVDVFLSNHPPRDGSDDKMRALAERGSEDTHPFVMGEDALIVFDVFENCTLAQADRIDSGQYQPPE